MKTKRIFYTLICISLLLVLLLTVLENNAVAGSVGDNAPMFTLKDLNGKDISLADFKGKPVFLNFWATWCPYCRKERKELDILYKKYKDKDLVIISIALDNSKRKVVNFMKNHPAEYIVLADTKMTSGAMYGVSGFPTTFLIDREGVIKYKAPGYRKWSSSVSVSIIDKLIK